MDIGTSFRIAAQGMGAQSARLNVIAENIANARSTPLSKEDAPYRRKTIIFGEPGGRSPAGAGVEVKEIVEDQRLGKREFMPGHPAADDAGMVTMPNVDIFIEMADMREASRSYQANLQSYKSAREMFEMQIDLLRGA